MPEGRRYTILFAEDEAPLRVMFGKVFEKNGFAVLTARNGQEALRMAAEHSGSIDLLVSNVQMPGMTGPELARALRTTRPGLRVMLISGYAEGLLLLDSGWVFLQKPVLPRHVVAKMFEILDRPPASDVDRGSDSGWETGGK